MPPAVRIFLTRVLPLAFVVVGALMSYYNGRAVLQGRASAGWPSAEGRVIMSSVNSRSSRTKSIRKYTARVVYSYAVDGRKFNGDRVTFCDGADCDHDSAYGVTNRYPVGRRVTVRYKPGNPKECVLEPGARWDSWLLLVFGLLFLGVGIPLALLMPGAIRKQEERDARRRAGTG